MRNSRIVVAVALSLGLAGCGGWYGEEEAPPLPGERKSVMLLDDGIVADTRIADLSIELPAPRTNATWPQTGGNAAHAMHHLMLSESPKQVWRADIGAGGDSRTRLMAQPVAAAGNVFTLDAEGTVSAFAASDGSLVWRFEPEGLDPDDRVKAGGLAFADGWLFVTTGSGDVIGLDAASGTEVWRRGLGAPIRTAPTVAGDAVLVLTGNNQLYALRADSGDLLWQHAGFFEPAAILGGAAPAADAGLVVVAYSSGEVFALRLIDGGEIWSDTVLRPRRTLAIGAISDITGAPVIDQGRVIVAGNGGEMAALDLRSGARAWDVDLTSRNAPWVAGDYIYVVTDRNEVVALLRQGGRVRWVSPLSRLSDPDDPDSTRVFWAGPVLAGDRLILAGSTGEAVTLSPYTGEILGRIKLPGSVSLPPVIADGTLYFLTDSGELLAWR